VELFKITCVTCNAKLSVRNRELIGQIVACPRCESMVQVEAPAVVAGLPAFVENVAEQSVQPSDLGDSEVDSEVESVVAEPEQPLADEISTPTVTSVAKYRLVAWTLACFAVGAALGGATLFLRGGSTEGEVAEESLGSEQVVTPPKNVEAEVPLEAPVEISQQPLPGDPLVEAEVPLVEVDGVEPEQAAPQETPPPEIVGEKMSADAEPRVASRFDALDLDPDTLDLETLKSASGEQAVEQPMADVSGNEAPPKNPQPDIASTLPAVRRDPNQQQDETLPQAERLLEQRFRALAVKGMPISDFLNLLSRLGGVPISVGPQQLQMAGITSRKSVSLDVKDISLAEALRQVLEPLHLEYTAVGGQVVVVRQGAATVRTIDYPLEDLLNSTTRLEDLLGWVEQLVVPAAQPPLEQTISLKTIANILSVEQAQQFQYQVLIFLEQLRLAREIPLRSRFPVKRLAGSASNATLAERLRASTTFTFSHYTSVDEIVRYWQQELGIPILVDWPALAELGLRPNSRIACAVENEPWPHALDQVLEPLGLGWRAVVGGAVEITSATKVQTELQLELYRLERELGDQAEQVLSSLRGIAEKGIAGKGPAKIAYDPAGKVLIVLQSAPAQRLVYQWLVDKKLLPND